MKKLYFFVVCLIIFNSYSQEKTPISNYDLTKKVEDKNGHLITNIQDKINYFEQQKKQIALQNTSVCVSKKALTPVYLCSNGTFEEYHTLGTQNYLNDFQFIDGGLLNPIQCRDYIGTASNQIIQYNPSNMNIMATTVPANYIDEYIGNINAFDQFALKINYKESSNTASLIQSKRFKTNNESSFVFNYKAVLQSIDGTDHDNEQPFFKARIINKQGVVVSEFCVIGDVNNCIFTQAPVLESGSIVLYTPNWQSGILDISSIPNNEDFTLELLATRCGLGAHFGYVYIDDICLLHSNETLQGSIELDPLNKVCPTMPLAVCGSFSIPSSGGISATISSIELTVKDSNDTIVYSTQATTTLDLVNKRFCFNLDTANFPNTTSGTYNVGVTINYGILQTNCSGTNFNSAHDDDANPGWDIWFLNCTNCPIDVQTTQLKLCDGNKDGKEIFNLTTAETNLVNSTAGLTFSYFETLADATNNTNPIATPLLYESYSTTIFVRITLNPTCYKVIPLSLVVINPHATISGILNVCYGSTTLTASSGTSYLWYDGQTTQSISVSNVGTYTVTVTDSNGCSSIGTATILATQVAPQPTLQITQPTCTSTTGVISVLSPAVSYSFDNGSTWGTTSTISNLAVGTYHVKIQTVAGCFSYATDVNIVNYLSSFPDFTAVNPLFCGDLGSITITSVADYYSFDDGLTWTTNNTATNLSPGTYNIRTKDISGCVSNYNSVPLFGEFLSPPLYTKYNPYCGNLGSITIDTPASEYSFDGGTTWQTSNTLSNLSSGSYILKIKNSQGCTSPTEYVYLNNLEYTYPDFTTDEPDCNKYGTLTILTPGDYYSFDNGATWTTNNILTNILGNTTIYIKVKKNPNCVSYSSAVYFYHVYEPNPTPNDYTTTECDKLNDGLEPITLSNYCSNIISNPTNYSFEYYTSQTAAENQNSTLQINNYMAYVMSSSNNTVYVRVMTSTGCYAISKLTINLISSPIIHMEDRYPLCVNKSVMIFAGVGYDGYLWSTNQTSEHISITQPNNYWVDVYENHPNGLTCSSRKDFTVFLSNYATTINVETIDWTENDNVITVHVTGIGSYEYSLDGVHYQDSNVFSNLEIGTYFVSVRDKYGCGIVGEDVFLLYYPKFFTPNDDNCNDTWKVKFSQYESGLTVDIFDRAGKLLKVLDNTYSWDGKLQGNLMPSDDYWFVVHRANGKVHKGHFTLKR